jgi:hypothetical protein
MKKMFSGLVLAALAVLPACNSDETVDVPTGRAIEFAGSIVDKSTRSTDYSKTTENLPQIQFYGWGKKDGSNFIVFDDEVVAHVSSATTPYYSGDPYWTYFNTQYWVESAEYTFSAIYGNETSTFDSSSMKNVTSYNGELTISDTENKVRAEKPKIVGYESDGETDLLYSETTATGLASGNKPVSFVFQHQMAKVRFAFQNNTNPYTNLDCKVTNIKMTNPLVKGDVELSNEQYGAVWSNQEEGTEALEFGDAYDTTTGFLPLYSLETQAQDPYALSDEKLVIPADNTHTYNVTFTVTIYLNGFEDKSFDCEAEIKNVEFKPGYAYNFNAVLNEAYLDGSAGLEKIVFDDITVTTWTDASDNNEIWNRFTDTENSVSGSESGNGNLGGGTTGGGLTL